MRTKTTGLWLVAEKTAVNFKRHTQCRIFYELPFSQVKAVCLAANKSEIFYEGDKVDFL